MENLVTIRQIEDRLRRLPPEKLGVVNDFISCMLDREKLGVVCDFISRLLDRDGSELLGKTDSDSLQTMLASERVLRRDWDRAEEDAAWADL